ncbi:hypothetical protein Y695_04847 [Hydrogenophaga sp. T4]|nr:hypothetical protein Y695_04847 [Hydrogenophaga sp. T4]
MPPTSAFSMVKMLELRSHLASLVGTSTRMRTLPSSANSSCATLPMAKPANVMSMPATTPSESSDISTSRCVRSKAPRAYITYSAEPTISASNSSSSSAALNSRLFTGGTGSGTGPWGFVGFMDGVRGGFNSSCP